MGGISAVTAGVVKLFADEEKHDLRRAGLRVKLADGTEHHLFLKIEIILADEAALHAVYANKGSSGLKPCILCQNIFNYNTARDIVGRDGTGFSQHHVCSDSRKLVLHTRATISACLDRLRHASTTMGKLAFEELQTRLGWNFTAGSLLTDQRLLGICDPSACVLFDWMHVFMVNGVFNVHVGQLVAALREHQITYQSLASYVSNWSWPRLLGNRARDVFCPKRARANTEHRTLKATASECLSLLPLLARYFAALGANSTIEHVKDHCSCFLGLVQIIETILKSARRPVDCNALQRTIDNYMAAFKAMYGPECMIIKFHYMMHYPLFLRRWRPLPNCFALERKHKMPKRYGNEIRNTSSNWDASVLREATNHHLGALTSTNGHFRFDAGLVDEHPVKPKLGASLQAAFGAELQFNTANVARINEWERCCVGDVVLADNEDAALVGEVVMHLSYTLHGEYVAFSCIRKWQPTATLLRSAKWLRTQRLEFVLVRDIRCALIWAASGDQATTLQALHS